MEKDSADKLRTRSEVDFAGTASPRQGASGAPKPFMWFGLGVVMAVIVGGSIYFLANGGKKPVQVSPSPEVTASPASVSIAGWQTYANSELGFSFMYPRNYFQYQQESPDIGIYLAPSAGEGGKSPKFLKPGDVWMDISVQSGANLSSVDHYLNLQGQGDFYKNAQKEPVTIGGEAGYKVIYSFPAVAGDATIYNYEGLVLRNEKIYKVVMSAWSQEALSGEQVLFDQILSTFTFVAQSEKRESPEPSPKPVVKPPLLDTTNWQDVSLSGIRFKVPSDARYNSSTNNDMYIYMPNLTYWQVYVLVRTYDGGSRRAWWIKEMKASPEQVKKYMSFGEVQLGQVAALDVFSDGGWWQNNYSSPILIAQGTTIVQIHGGRSFNADTGEILRGQLSDTVASTIRFN